MAVGVGASDFGEEAWGKDGEEAVQQALGLTCVSML